MGRAAFCFITAASPAPTMKKFIQDILYLLSRRDLIRFGILTGVLLCSSVLELLALGAVPYFISTLWPDSAASSLLPDWIAPSWQLAVNGGIVILLNLLRTSWAFFTLQLQNRMLANRRVELSTRLLRCYLTADGVLLGGRNRSDLVNRAVNECERIIREVATPMLDLCQYSALLICIAVLLLWQIPVMTMISLSLLAIFGGSFMIFSRARKQKDGILEQEKRTAAITSAAEALGCAADAAILGKRSFFLDIFRRNVESAAAARRRYDVQLRFIWPYLELVSIGVITAVFIFSLMRADGNLAETAPSVALLATALVRLRTILINILASAEQLRFSRASLAVVAEDLRALDRGITEEDVKKSDAVPPLVFRDKIVLKDVSFCYPGAAVPALRGINLSIAKGEFIGIAGTTGSGKSTLLKLLLGLLEPTGGSITVDGRPMQEIRTAWQHCAGYVPQQLFLTEDTLAANVALGVPTAERDTAGIRSAVEAAQLRDICPDDDALNLPVGENGTLLSGGQRQRIAVARALYGNPAVIFFDEATSALDNLTEQRLADAMEAVLGAVYLDGGHEAAAVLIRKLYEGRWPEAGTERKSKDYKTRLQEATQAILHSLPVYVPLSSTGPEHAKVFCVQLDLSDGRSFTAEGASLKRAEQEAARIALDALGVEEK